MIAKKNRPKGRLSVARFIYNKSKSKIKIKAPAIENKSAIIKPLSGYLNFHLKRFQSHNINLNHNQC